MSSARARLEFAAGRLNAVAGACFFSIFFMVLLLLRHDSLRCPAFLQMEQRCVRLSFLKRGAARRELCPCLAPAAHSRSGSFTSQGTQRSFERSSMKRPPLTSVGFSSGLPEPDGSIAHTVPSMTFSAMQCPLKSSSSEHSTCFKYSPGVLRTCSALTTTICPRAWTRIALSNFQLMIW